MYSYYTCNSIEPRAPVWPFFQLKKPLTMREFTQSLKSATLRVELNCQGRDLRLCKPSCISFRTMGKGGTNSGSFANLQLSTLVAISADHYASKCYFSGTFPRKICLKRLACTSSPSIITAILMSVELLCLLFFSSILNCI